MSQATLLQRLRRRGRRTVAHQYKNLLGRLLAYGSRLNTFEYPPGQWPPPTPARKYIVDFLTLYRHEVRGRCVEFYPAFYRELFADTQRVSSYDVWNTSPADTVTVVADLLAADDLPSESFDTIICTHVLCSLARPWVAVPQLRRLLAPGGLILCTNPAVSPTYSPHPKDYWRFTRDSMEMLFEDFDRVRLHSYGNAATVAASPMYVMVDHLPVATLEAHDANCPSIVAVAAWK